MKTAAKDLNTVLVTDCGSTTTKAVLFQKTQEGWRQTFRGEAPTTVEEPVADVTVGALNAFTEIQEISKREILLESEQETPFLISDNGASAGIDLYLSTSSAGGGLQMIVGGVVREMTAESAQRAALGAGAIVLDTLSADDRRQEHELIDRVRHLKPDIVLLTGGIDGGSRTHVVEVAEMLLAASPKPRFGETLKLPVIYAGNKDAYEEVKHILESIAHIEMVENVRPTLEQENLKPARDRIHEFFLTHVMSHAPGYDKLMHWTPVPVMPTPGAVGDMVHSYATQSNQQVIAVDIGGATTDVFSVFKNHAKQEFVFNRTVSANLGMSYSVANVLIEAGTFNIARWLPYSMKSSEIHDRLRNKMIRPTSIPQTIEDLHLEQAVCREALRLSFNHHRSLAVGLSGVRSQRGIADIFSQTTNREELVNMRELDLIIGSGGVLSHAPDRKTTALMLIDAYQPQGVTQLAVDSIFMLPHLGVFSSVHPEAASEILERDCLIVLGQCIAPIYPASLKLEVLAEVFLDQTKIGEVRADQVALLTPDFEHAELKIIPTHKRVDVGAGAGKEYLGEYKKGIVGLVVDGRNRPMKLIDDLEQCCEMQKLTFNNIGIEF